jgi:hypothetical protein
MSGRVATLLMAAFLIFPFVVFQLWWWAACFTVIAAVVGIFEAVAKAKTDKTLSQQFWAWSLQNKAKSWIIIGSLLIAWLILLLHLTRLI